MIQAVILLNDLHSPQNNLNVHIKTEPFTIAFDICIIRLSRDRLGFLYGDIDFFSRILVFLRMVMVTTMFYDCDDSGHSNKEIGNMQYTLCTSRKS